MGKPLRGESSASGQVVTFLVAGTLFVAAVGAILLTARQAGHADRGAREASQQEEAARLADLLVASPGVGWPLGNDRIVRLGLGAANGSGLQPSSLEALRGALLTTAPDGKVDYPDARASLGLTGSQDFHLRVYPLGSAVPSGNVSHLRTAYIGHWSSLATMRIGTQGSGATTMAAQDALNLSMFPAAAQERQALRHLGLDYDDQVFISSSLPLIVVTATAASQAIHRPTLVTVGSATVETNTPFLAKLGVPLVEGDVYPDDKNYLANGLPSRLPGYDVLVVGSQVDQSALTSNQVKGAVADWVQAGGTLIILGSSAQNYQWLQPLFSAGVKTANGAASAPDPSHPLLREPHRLDWRRYDDHGMGWDLQQQSAEGFSHVVVRAGTDVLAISNDGALGAGRVLLTTYRAGEIAATLGQEEAENLLENILLYTDRAKLFLEYGPAQPADLPVAVAVRQSFLHDDRLGQVPVRLEVHFWGNAG